MTKCPQTDTHFAIVSPTVGITRTRFSLDVTHCQVNGLCAEARKAIQQLLKAQQLSNFLAHFCLCAVLYLTANYSLISLYST